MIPITDESRFVSEAVVAFERAIGVTGVPHGLEQVGNKVFLKFAVGRECPLYDNALFESQIALSEDNPFKGALALAAVKTRTFPGSIEANALLTLLTRSTREVSQGGSSRGYSVPYVPFQKREDHQLAQPATHIVRGRRGVGKSTLIRRATDLLADGSSVVCVLDMQGYSTESGDELTLDVMYDACAGFVREAEILSERVGLKVDVTALKQIVQNIELGALNVKRAPIIIKRALSTLTAATKGNVFLFLDDFHLIDRVSQPHLLHALNGALKGANGWLKVAGLTSLLNVYSPEHREGLQHPGDAQFISLDLTLENPEAAETHLRAILEGFLNAVGYRLTRDVIPDAAFRRLAWANAGVPRDFLQMFARSLEHATRNRHAAVTLSDVNVAIGEFGQQKMDDLQKDARNEAGLLQKVLAKLEDICLVQNRINAFLFRSDDPKEQMLMQILSDLRMVHLINQSITPRKSGERFQAYILDYSMFTGVRRRPNIQEMIPKQLQFRASELRALPKVGPDVLMSAMTETAA